jgi:hypothetical protein
MKHWGWLAAAVVVALAAGGCSKKVEAPKPPSMTVKDIMDTQVDPSGDFLFESVQEISDEKGVRRKAPASDAEWQEVRRHLTVLDDAARTLAAGGLKAAGPNDKSAAPGVENEPAEIDRLMATQPVEFATRAHRLGDAAGAGLRAVGAKNVDELVLALGQIDRACEGCHLHFWYPNDERAREQARAQGIP